MLQTVALFLPADVLVMLNETKRFHSLDKPEDAAACATISYCLCAKVCLEGYVIKIYRSWRKDKPGKGYWEELTPRLDHFEETSMLKPGLSNAYPLEFKVPSKVLESGFELLGCHDDFSLLCNAAEFYLRYTTLRQQGFCMPVIKASAGNRCDEEVIAFTLFPNPQQTWEQ